MPAPGSTLTFQANKNSARHSWLHLTPAYAADLVSALLSDLPAPAHVFDPFAGSGTTLIRGAECGHRCTGWDINPFLQEVIQAKATQLNQAQAAALHHDAEAICQQARTLDSHLCAEPAMHTIERWWSELHRLQLRQLKTALHHYDCDEENRRLLRMAFAWSVKRTAKVDHRHHSLSFTSDEQDVSVFSEFLNAAHSIMTDCQSALPGDITIVLHDARLPAEIDADLVITSPPYPNRMSYMRELRPYLYWLDYIDAAHQAADLDWLAIGGSWGTATNRLKTWQAQVFDHAVPALIRCLAQLPDKNSSPIIKQYLIRYCHDMLSHFKAMRSSLRAGTPLQYIIGNARYYGVGFDSDQVFCELLDACGFVDITSRVLRRRSSSRQLFEYCVSARNPANSSVRTGTAEKSD